MSPSSEEITTALNTLRTQCPDLGKKKLLGQLNADNGWDISNKDFRIYMTPVEEQEKEQAQQEPSRAALAPRDTERTQMAKVLNVFASLYDNEEKPACSEKIAPPASNTNNAHPSQKYNCFLIRAKPQTTQSPLTNISAKISLYHLQHYGTETGEQLELQNRLGWRHVTAVGKYYDHLGSDNWYYYVYGSQASRSAPKNEVGSLVCYQAIRGDIAVIRSGPVGNDEYPVDFSREELSQAVEWYKTHDRSSVFHEREKSRVMRNAGFGGLGAGGMKPVYTNWHKGGGFTFS